jgi:DNA-binding NarL/FixJ family response regulator
MMNNNLSSIIVCDDHYLTALGVELALLQNFSHPLTIRKATTGHEALELFKQSSPDLLLIDLNLPDISGLEVIRRIRESCTTSRIIVLTGQSEPYLLKQVCGLGVNGLLKKSDTAKNLSDALDFIRTNGRDKMYLDSFMQSIVWDGETYVPTKREFEILALMSQGLTSNMIALKLDCSVATIKTHRSRIMNKSGSRNSAEMIAWFLQGNGKDNFSSNT